MKKGTSINKDGHFRCDICGNEFGKVAYFENGEMVPMTLYLACEVDPPHKVLDGCPMLPDGK